MANPGHDIEISALDAEANAQSGSDSQRWRSLIEKAQAGDKKAYNRLLKQLHPYIENVLRPGLSNPEWVNDITQDVLLSLHKSLHTYNPERPFKPWLMAIIHFRKSDFMRKHYASHDDRKVDFEEPAFFNRHVTSPVASGEFKDIEAALNMLPEQQRNVFQMMKIYGYSANEVATMTGMSTSAVKVSVHRSWKKIRNHYEKNDAT
jgi:RNA polymerase sigma-70 factor (ECF subfamily)